MDQTKPFKLLKKQGKPLISTGISIQNYAKTSGCSSSSTGNQKETIQKIQMNHK